MGSKNVFALEGLRNLLSAFTVRSNGHARHRRKREENVDAAHGMHELSDCARTSRAMQKGLTLLSVAMVLPTEPTWKALDQNQNRFLHRCT